MSLLNVIYLALGVLGLFAFLSVVVLSLIWLERKVLGRIQLRMGPMRVGPFGTLQSLADALKLMTKEDLVPAWADKKVFWLAPVAVFLPSFLIWVTVPFARNMVLQNLDLGLFYIVAVSVLSVVGLIMAGWGSANKYATLGGLRAAAQLIAYEIPLVMALLGVGMLVGSLKLTDVVDGNVINVVKNGQVVAREMSGQHVIPFAVIQPLGLFLFFIAGLAEIGRTPFDIHHAESEISGGVMIEYSGMHWAVFFLAEYINTFALAALTVLLFFGGWAWPEMPFTVLSVLWFVFKAYLVVLVIFWLRATYPRLRIDQLMSFGWKLLVPLSFVNIVITGIYLYYNWPAWTLSAMSFAILIGVFYVIYKRPFSAIERDTIRVYPVKRSVDVTPAGAKDAS